MSDGIDPCFNPPPGEVDTEQFDAVAVLLIDMYLAAIEMQLITIPAMARLRPLPTTILVIHAQQLLEVRLTSTGSATQALCRPCGRPSGLSLRELQVMAELTRGLTNREIACSLAIGVRTVATHVEHILAKLGLPNRAAAAARAAAWGLTPLLGDGSSMHHGWVAQERSPGSHPSRRDTRRQRDRSPVRIAAPR